MHSIYNLCLKGLCFRAPAGINCKSDESLEMRVADLQK